MKLVQKGNKVWTNNGQFVLCPSNVSHFQGSLSGVFRKDLIFIPKQKPACFFAPCYNFCASGLAKVYLYYLFNQTKETTVQLFVQIDKKDQTIRPALSVLYNKLFLNY